MAFHSREISLCVELCPYKWIFGPGRVVKKKKTTTTTKDSMRSLEPLGKRALFMPVGTDLVKCLFKRDATW